MDIPLLDELRKARFWSHVEVSHNGYCWPFKGSKDGSGYGMFLISRRVFRAHRISFSIFNGSIPDDKVVRHLCHNPACCNPKHLAIGTAQDNSDDTTSAHRHAFGRRIFTARLSEADVLNIREMGKLGNVSGTVIGKMYGITRQHANLIKKGRYWSHLNGSR